LIHCYLDTGGKPRKEIPLGTDYLSAVQKWADLTKKKPPSATTGTFAEVLEHYWENVIPTKGAPYTGRQRGREGVAAQILQRSAGVARRDRNRCRGLALTASF
jgi:hypothetical protein